MLSKALDDFHKLITVPFLVRFPFWYLWTLLRSFQLLTCMQTDSVVVRADKGRVVYTLCAFLMEGKMGSDYT